MDKIPPIVLTTYKVQKYPTEQNLLLVRARTNVDK